MAKTKIFISYDYDNDRHYKNMLLAWDKNDDFVFAFSDQSADVSIQSSNADAIKRAISAKINSATHLLCLVGAKTLNSKWVAWEIDKAKELKKKLVAVKITSGNATPSGLLNAGASWAMSFSLDSIKKAIGQ
mgnify:CR=1 FL=1